VGRTGQYQKAVGLLGSTPNFYVLSCFLAIHEGARGIPIFGVRGIPNFSVLGNQF